MFRRSFSAAVLFVSLALSNRRVTLAQTTAPTLVEYLASDADLSTWNAVITTTGYNVSGVDSTIFAPTNDAFMDLDSLLLASLLNPSWSEHLLNVLLMHISTIAAIQSSQLSDGDEIIAANTERLLVSIANGNISVSSPNTDNSVVVEADIVVAEGVLHKVDKVLLPAFTSTSLLDLVGGDGFTILTEFLTLTGLAAAVGPNAIATIFAPTDDAFDALPDGALDYYRANIDVITKLLAGHVIPNAVIPTTAMVDGPIADTTAGGTTLTVTIEELDGTEIYMIDNATISIPNVLANNGIIHGITAVLAVPGTEYATAAPVAVPFDVIDLGNGRRQSSFASGQVLLTFITDEVNQALTVTMEYDGLGWLGFAISDDLLMPNSLAVIALPDDGTSIPLKYDIGSSRTQSAVVAAPADRQTLTDAMYVQNATHTAMTFTKRWVEANELPIVLSGTIHFLYAVGSSNTFGYHESRQAFAFDFATLVAEEPTMDPVLVEDGGSLVLGAVIGGVVGGMMILALVYWVFRRRKANDDSQRSAPIPTGAVRTSAQFPPTDPVPSVLADPVWEDHHRAIDNSVVSNVPFAAVTPIPDTVEHGVSYKDQCRPAAPSASTPHRGQNHRALPIIRLSDTVGTVDRGDRRLPLAAAPRSSDFGPQEI